MQLSSSSMKQGFSRPFTQESISDRVEALRAVVMLLLREVESLEKSISVDADFSNEDEVSLADRLTQIEIDAIRCAMIKANGRQKTAAKLLGMKLTTLNAKLKKYEIDWRLPDTNYDLVV